MNYRTPSPKLIAINSSVITTYVEHPKAIEVVAILGMKFRRNLMNAMDQ
jgi:hypothetical protein